MREICTLRSTIQSGWSDAAVQLPRANRPSPNGNQLSWKVSISDPMPLTLEFNGTVDGDEVSGSVTLGNFGSSSFSGTRS